MLARALAQEARLLLLDEPTAFLDLKHRLAVYTLLGRLHRENGLTVVVVSHDINLAARYCDRLVLLRCGAIAADGTPAEVLRPDPIRSVYEVEVEIGTDPSSGRPFVIPKVRSWNERAGRKWTALLGGTTVTWRLDSPRCSPLSA